MNRLQGVWPSMDLYTSGSYCTLLSREICHTFACVFGLLVLGSMPAWQLARRLRSAEMRPWWCMSSWEESSGQHKIHVVLQSYTFYINVYRFHLINVKIFFSMQAILSEDFSFFSYAMKLHANNTWECNISPISRKLLAW